MIELVKFVHILLDSLQISTWVDFYTIECPKTKNTKRWHPHSTKKKLSELFMRFLIVKLDTALITFNSQMNGIRNVLKASQPNW
ncbi:unnamed protein product, partial [Mesorhabditis belari]|uniref:Uncharacterized protein n=1 Tax=Mesorhabditis belari TaxID=2138241 RepID=A0AAF3EHA8_9BILA